MRNSQFASLLRTSSPLFVTRFFSRSICRSALIALLALPAPFAAADRANGPELQRINAEMLRIAEAFLATVAEPAAQESAVGYNRRELVTLAHDDPARTNYVYWPHLRKGLPLDYMNVQQRMLVHELLNAALSAKGYLTTVQIMQLERILQDTETTGFPRGAENYTLAFFGTPGADTRWGWRFEGHHLSLNFTVAPNELSVTPSFLGASPAKIPNGTLAGFRSQRDTHDAGLQLINAMDDAQRAQAIAAGNPPFDILAGTLNRPMESWDEWKALPPEGIAVSALNARQKDLVQHLLDTIVTTYRPEISESYLRQIDVNDLRFVWYGGTNDGDAHYWRLEGSDFFFEYDLVQGDGNHVHTIWRSKNGDFGGDLLRQHRAEAH